MWRWIPYERYSPEWNMAVDEAILLAHREGRVPPTLRFYGWKVPTLSIGYFQRVREVVDLDQVEALGYGLVRRITGGRSVLHDQELTYSIIVSEDHPQFSSSVSDSYRKISQGLLLGYRKLGLQAELAPPKAVDRRAQSAACFDSPSDYELVIEGRKAAGSAQTRKEGVILQHGSILIDIDDRTLFSLLIFPLERIRSRMQQAFRKKAIAIHQIRDQEVSMDEMIAAFFYGFTGGIGLSFREEHLTDYEKEIATQLVRQKYGHPDWTYRR